MCATYHAALELWKGLAVTWWVSWLADSQSWACTHISPPDPGNWVDRQWAQPHYRYLNEGKHYLVVKKNKTKNKKAEFCCKCVMSPGARHNVQLHIAELWPADCLSCVMSQFLVKYQPLIMGFTSYYWSCKNVNNTNTVQKENVMCHLKVSVSNAVSYRSCSLQGPNEGHRTRS